MDLFQLLDRVTGHGEQIAVQCARSADLKPQSSSVRHRLRGARGNFCLPRSRADEPSD
jgi:hypothetical protein